MIITVLLIGYYFFNQYYNFSIPCLFHKLTNLYCPGCGITRMIFSLFKFDFVQAFRYNQLVFILLVLYVLFLNFKLIFKLELSNKQKNIIAYTLLCITIIFGILRNIPFFDYLKPTILK